MYRVAGIAIILCCAAQGSAAEMTREQDSQCLAAISREAQPALEGRATDKLTKDFLRAAPFYAGKLSVRYTHDELLAAIQSADREIRDNPRRRTIAVTCWQMFELEMMAMSQKFGATE